MQLVPVKIIPIDSHAGSCIKYQKKGDRAIVPVVMIHCIIMLLARVLNSCKYSHKIYIDYYKFLVYISLKKKWFSILSLYSVGEIAYVFTF